MIRVLLVDDHAISAPRCACGSSKKRELSLSVKPEPRSKQS
jgi:hypothetical protein